MENNVILEMKPTIENLSLMRLILSYFCQSKDFDISVIDKIKFIVSNVINIVSCNNIDQETVKIDISFDEIQIKTMVYVKSEKSINTNLNYKIEIKKLLDNSHGCVEFLEKPNNEYVIILNINNEKING